METKAHFLVDKQNFGFFETSSDQYSNLNLNQNYQSLHPDNVQSKRALNKSEKYAVTKLSDLMVSVDLQAKKDSHSWNKSNKKLSPKFLNLNQKSEEEHEFAKESKNINKSTLSLHIATYENSTEDTPDSDAFEKEGIKRKDASKDLLKKWDTGSSLVIENPFEFPRQQENQNKHPEVVQFKASQKLRNPNEVVNEKTNTLETSKKDSKPAKVDVVTPVAATAAANTTPPPVTATTPNPAAAPTTPAAIIAAKLETSKKDSKPAKDDASKSSKERKSLKEGGKSKIADTPGKSSKSKKEKESVSKKEPEKKLQLKDLIRKHLLAGSVRMEYELWELHQLLDMAKISMQKKSTLIDVRTPVNICGDIHGQYGDLMRIFNSCGMPFKSRYLFLGDYVDRGRHSLEVIVLLFACQIQFPNNIFLLRGNHELSNINRVYGFHAELRTRYRSVLDSKQLYDHFNEIFSEMPLAAIVEGKILCMHGGLSPELNHLDDIRKIKRPLLIVRGLAQDLLWADPESGVKGFQPNKIRAVSHVFGEDAVQSKTKQLGIDMVIRAHQVVEFGYAFFANRQLVTVFSAARYHEDLCNFAAVVQVDDRLELAFMQLKPSEFDQQKKEKIVATMDCDEENDDDNNNPGGADKNKTDNAAAKDEAAAAP
uniref:Serine/threonine-protein phosphatase n=1 Tax=Panagrolaimus sp. ES5 TaxID=591445 RepID=A0AC34F9L3_9BILA